MPSSSVLDSAHYYREICDIHQALFSSDLFESKAPGGKGISERLYPLLVARTLDCLFQAFHRDGTLKCPDGVVQILSQYWEETRGTSLSYTSTANRGLHKLLYRLAAWESQKRQIPAIQLLIPGLSIKSNLGVYPDLSTLDPETVFKTHILGGDFKHPYLLPVHCVFDLIFEPDQRMLNPYYLPGEMDDKFAFIGHSERERLITHSVETWGLHNAYQRKRFIRRTVEINALREAYQRDGLIGHFFGTSTLNNAYQWVCDVEKNAPDLLSCLNRLYQVFRVSDAYSNAGEETQARDAVYLGIISFNEYFNKLSDAAKQKIPNSITGELQRLLDAVSTTDTDDRIVARIGRCRKNLWRAIQQYQEELQDISLDKRSLVFQQAEKKLGRAYNRLFQSLDNNTYAGCDDLLPFNVALFKRYAAHLSIDYWDDLHEIMQCDSADIKTILSTFPEQRKQVAQLLNSYGSIFRFMYSGYMSSNIRVVFEHALPQKLTIARNWSVLLEAPLFDGAYRLLCSVLNKNFSLVVKSRQDFLEMLQGLSLNRASILVLECNENIMRLVQSIRHFIEIERHLSFEYSLTLMSLHKDQFVNLLKTPEDARCLMARFLPHELDVVLDLLISTLPSLLQSPADYWMILELLSVKQRGILLCDEHVKRFFTSPQHLNDLFSHMKSYQHSDVRALLGHGLNAEGDSREALDKMPHDLQPEHSMASASCCGQERMSSQVDDAKIVNSNSFFFNKNEVKQQALSFQSGHREEKSKEPEEGESQWKNWFWSWFA